jgi:hypothetical protein
MGSQPTDEKARSIEHCCQIASSRRLSVERKYSGEYYQIHNELTKNINSIKLFSKSGKDSTNDDIGLQCVLRDSLRLGSAKWKIVVVVGQGRYSSALLLEPVEPVASEENFLGGCLALSGGS